MELEDCQRRLTHARVATLATVGIHGPHLVPVVFAMEGDKVFTAVDHKPKRSRRLQRMRNIVSDPAVSLLADHYDDDWTQLWWVRADGMATIIDDPAQMKRGLDLLVAKYDQYLTNRPQGPVIEIAVERWSGWAAASG